MFSRKPQPPPAEPESADDDDPPDGGGETKRFNLAGLLTALMEQRGSDLHVTTGSPPQLRIKGELIPLKVDPLTPLECKQLMYSVLTAQQVAAFERELQLCMSFGVKGLGRFRLTLTMQRGAVDGVFRALPFAVKPLGELGFGSALVDAVQSLASASSGLVLAGCTGRSLALVVAHLRRLELDPSLSDHVAGLILTRRDGAQFGAEVISAASVREALREPPS